MQLPGVVEAVKAIVRGALELSPDFLRRRLEQII